MGKKLSDIAMEQGDAIALFSASLIAVLLVTLDILPEKYAAAATLSVLCFLAFHHLRRTLHLDRIDKRIDDISESVRSIEVSSGLLKNIGVIGAVRMQRLSSYDQMHREATTAKRVFVLSRYFSAFGSISVQTALRQCLAASGTVQILIYSPQGNHFNVAIEPDIISVDEAKAKISATVRRLRAFKGSLPGDLRDRFEYKTIANHVIYASITGMPQKIYATMYLNELRGDECPVIICQPTMALRDSLYSAYLDEFERLWSVADPDVDFVNTNG